MAAPNKKDWLLLGRIRLLFLKEKEKEEEGALRNEDSCCIYRETGGRSG